MGGPDADKGYDTVHRCKICHTILDTIESIEAHVKIPVTGKERQVGGLYSFENDRIKEYRKVVGDNEIWIPGLLIRSPSEIAPTHARVYSPTIFTYYKSNSKSEITWQDDLTWHMFFNDIYKNGEDITLYLRELSEEDFRKIYNYFETGTKTIASRSVSLLEWIKERCIIPKDQQFQLIRGRV